MYFHEIFIFVLIFEWLLNSANCILILPLDVCFRWRVIDYYLSRVKGNLQIMNKLDLIDKTSEFARVFGIEFYDVLSRGSQVQWPQEVCLRMI